MHWHMWTKSSMFVFVACHLEYFPRIFKQYCRSGAFLALGARFSRHLYWASSTKWYFALILGIDTVDNKDISIKLKSFSEKHSGLKVVSFSYQEASSLKKIMKSICSTLEIPNQMDIGSILAHYKTNFPASKLIFLVEEIDRIEHQVLSNFLASFQLILSSYP